jgi:hypothetical protein
VDEVFERNAKMSESLSRLVRKNVMPGWRPASGISSAPWRARRRRGSPCGVEHNRDASTSLLFCTDSKGWQSAVYTG